MDGSLFRAVDVGELETKVLAEADQRARDASIPQFFVSSNGEGLGFGPSSLGSFCSTTDPFIFRLAADVARREGRELREGGVGNLAARDRVSSLPFSYGLCVLCVRSAAQHGLCSSETLTSAVYWFYFCHVHMARLFLSNINSLLAVRLSTVSGADENANFERIAAR